MSQRSKYSIQPSPDGWEGMMEGPLRVSAVYKNREIASDGIGGSAGRRSNDAGRRQHAD